uniref:Uncharacterized protein n=1 Tax=Cacopsylla melanoneura TaxID=428564 RepID=A0A8D8ZHL2_9HEMI
MFHLQWKQGPNLGNIFPALMRTLLKEPIFLFIVFNYKIVPTGEKHLIVVQRSILISKVAPENFGSLLPHVFLNLWFAGTLNVLFKTVKCRIRVRYLNYLAQEIKEKQNLSCVPKN